MRVTMNKLGTKAVLTTGEVNTLENALCTMKNLEKLGVKLDTVGLEAMVKEVVTDGTITIPPAIAS